jgi:hypothetical protein
VPRALRERSPLKPVGGRPSFAGSLSAAVRALPGSLLRVLPILLVLIPTDPVHAAGRITGKAGIEFEYLSDRFFEESVLDLGIPGEDGAVTLDTVVTGEVSRLLGGSLRLAWDAADHPRTPYSLEGSVNGNEERSEAAFLGTVKIPTGGASSLRFRDDFLYHDSERSLFGNREWRNQLEAAFRWEDALLDRSLEVRNRLETSRSLDSSSTGVFDYDLDRLAVEYRRGPGWGLRTGHAVEFTYRASPDTLVGSYGELLTRHDATTGGDRIGEIRVRLEGARRVYRDELLSNRDAWRAEGDFGWSPPILSWADPALDWNGAYAAFDSSDEVYFTSFENRAGIRFRRGRASALTLEAGPRLRTLTDLSGQEGGYVQWSGLLTLHALFLGEGWLTFSNEAGRRTYESQSAPILAVPTLQYLLLRSDYTFDDLTGFLSIPLPGRVFFEAFANVSLEWHSEENGSVTIALISTSLTRRF